MRYFLFITLLIISSIFSVIFAQSPDFENMQEKIITNREYLRYLDVSLSNLDEGDLKKNLIEKYSTALRYDYYGKMHFLAGKYGKCYKELRDSQKLQNDILEVLLEEYVARTYILLEEAGPPIVKANDKYARFYAQSGFRFLKKAEMYLTQANNLSKTMIADQLFLYYESLHTVRKARRFGVRAHIEARIPLEEKKEHITVTLDDIANKELDVLNKSEFEATQNKLQNLLATKQIPLEFVAKRKDKEVKFSIIDMNVDNFAYYVPGRRSLFLDLSLTLTTEGMKEKEQARIPGDTVQSDYYYKQ